MSWVAWNDRQINRQTDTGRQGDRHKLVRTGYANDRQMERQTDTDRQGGGEGYCLSITNDRRETDANWYVQAMPQTLKRKRYIANTPGLFAHPAL